MKLYKIFSIWELLIFFLFIVIILLQIFFYFNNSSINERGIKALKNKDFLTAQKYFKQNIESGVLDSLAYLNLGLSYDLLKQPLKALEIYKTVSSSNDRNAGLFFSYFNQAELYGRLGDLEKALQSYQLALEFRQKEKEIKTNIELLLKQKSGQGSEGDDLENKDQSNGSDNRQSEKNKKGEEDKKKDQQKENQPQDDIEDQHSESGKDENTSEEKNSEEEQKEDQKDLDNRNQSENIKKGNEQILTEREQRAILEEVQKQENKVRTRVYQNKNIFGDKTKEDW